MAADPDLRVCPTCRAPEYLAVPMLIFWSIATLLVCVTLAALLWPLLRARPTQEALDAETAAIAVYRDQRQALDAECADGVIAPGEREAAIAELARRLGDELGAPLGAAGVLQKRRAWVVALSLLVLIPSAAGILYARLGNPGAATLAVAPPESGGHDLSEGQIEAMVKQLAERLESHPEEVQGWQLLARSYAALGRFGDAADAYAHADALNPNNADLLADYADALAMAQGKQLAGKPLALVRRALRIDPQHRKALALAATAAMDARDFDGALTYWRQLLAQFPPDSNDAKQISAIVAEVEAARRDRQGPVDQTGKGAGRPDQAAVALTPPATGGTVAGRVDIDAALAGKVAPTDAVFIFARAVDGPRMPLAVLRIRARELPKQFVLDDSMGMAPGMKLSTAPAVVVEARISKSGNALAQPGDLSGQSGPVKPGASAVNVTIDHVVP